MIARILGAIDGGGIVPPPNFRDTLFAAAAMVVLGIDLTLLAAIAGAFE